MTGFGEMTSFLHSSESESVPYNHGTLCFLRRALSTCAQRIARCLLIYYMSFPHLGQCFEMEVWSEISFCGL